MPEPQTPSPPPPSPGGVHISRGVTPRIPAGGLVIHMNAAGSPMGVARLELQLDTCIHWFEIALENLAQAKSGQAALLQLKAVGSGVQSQRTSLGGSGNLFRSSLCCYRGAHADKTYTSWPEQASAASKVREGSGATAAGLRPEEAGNRKPTLCAERGLQIS
jgi:hypothetical protein